MEDVWDELQPGYGFELRFEPVDDVPTYIELKRGDLMDKSHLEEVEVLTGMFILFFAFVDIVLDRIAQVG